jgi:SpoVK/Ycf46/Vps4 family AAA+-type ATPase
MPGVGKTMLAKAAINELTYKNKTTTDDKNTITTEVLFYAPTAAELKGKYVGESEKSIKALFDRASNEAAKK